MNISPTMAKEMNSISNRLGKYKRAKQINELTLLNSFTTNWDRDGQSITSLKASKHPANSIIMPIKVQRLFMANKEHVNIQYEDFIGKVFSLVRTKFLNVRTSLWFRSLHSACSNPSFCTSEGHTWCFWIRGSYCLPLLTGW